MLDPHDIETPRDRGDSAIVRAALQLEEEAVARYAEHATRTADPRLYAYWEALRRNETDHRDELRARTGAAAQ